MADKRECKHCEYCDTVNNQCYVTGDKCYENHKCLHENCKDYMEGTMFVIDSDVVGEPVERKEKMLKTHTIAAQQMFEELGYKKDKDFFPDTPTYTDEYRSLMITEAGVIIIGKFKQIVSLTKEEMEAVYKQIKELKQC